MELRYRNISQNSKKEYYLVFHSLKRNLFRWLKNKKNDDFTLRSINFKRYSKQNLNDPLYHYSFSRRKYFDLL